MNSVKSSYETLERLFNAHGVGLTSRLANHEIMPPVSDYLCMLYDDWRAHAPEPVLSRLEVEAYILRRLIASPVSGLRVVQKFYLAPYR